jgi:hypothetical protein
MKTFSANAIADLLERDRATVVRALRNVPHDAVERKQPRWKMTTALAALDRLPGSHNAKSHHRRNDGIVVHHNWLDPDNWRDSRIAAAVAEYNKTFAEMKAIEDIKQRRAFAIAKLAPLIDSHDKNFRHWETDNPAPGRFWNDTDSVSARVSLLWTQQIETVAAVCGWTDDEGRNLLSYQFYEEETEGTTT